MKKTENILVRKIGPLPVWAWAIIGGAALYWYRNRKSATTGASSTTAANTDDTGTPGEGYQNWPGWGGSQTGNGGGTGTNGTPGDPGIPGPAGPPGTPGTTSPTGNTTNTTTTSTGKGKTTAQKQAAAVGKVIKKGLKGAGGAIGNSTSRSHASTKNTNGGRVVSITKKQLKAMSPGKANLRTGNNPRGVAIVGKGKSKTRTNKPKIGTAVMESLVPHVTAAEPGSISSELAYINPVPAATPPEPHPTPTPIIQTYVTRMGVIHVQKKPPAKKPARKR